jgi:hypothetical protein
MLLNLKIPSDHIKAEVYFTKLVKDGSKIELKKIPEKRTIKQNSYVHVLFMLWGTHFGYSLDEAKQVVKSHLGYVYEKNGTWFCTKTSGMDTKELTTFIDRFRNWSSSEGLYLPSAEEYNLRHFDYSQEVERAEQIQKRYAY